MIDYVHSLTNESRISPDITTRYVIRWESRRNGKYRGLRSATRDHLDESCLIFTIVVILLFYDLTIGYRGRVSSFDGIANLARFALDRRNSIHLKS